MTGCANGSVHLIKPVLADNVATDVAADPCDVESSSMESLLPALRSLFRKSTMSVPMGRRWCM